jgi:dTDP-4-dehydrorhamnose reductase
MKVLVIGADGQLGTDLCTALVDFNVVPLTQRDIEITDSSSVKKALAQHRPDIIVNTAAYVRVDDCETNIHEAYTVNALGARNVAVSAQEINAKIVHLSTDYVFGGEARTEINPYTEYDNPVPLSVYGKSKLAGEYYVQHLNLKHFIVRTSGLLGKAGSFGKGGNFIETMLKLGRERDELKVVNDQVFSPTFTIDLSKKIIQIIKTEDYGIFHITNQGECSWFELAEEALKLAGIKTPVIPISSDQYPQQARRPSFSVLDNFHLKLLNMYDMRPWREALNNYMQERYE